jgi:hypothetical protein
MGTRKAGIAETTLNWLLEDENPSVRFLTLQNILDYGGGDSQLAAAKRLVMEEGPVPQILSHQNLDGSFLTGAMIKRYGPQTARSGYLPKYKSTIWQAIFLAQLGADRNDDRIRRLCRFILDTNYSAEHGTLGSYITRAGKIHFVTMPCYIANMTWALSILGFYNDVRIQDSIKWLLKYQRFDDGDFKTPNEWPYRGRNDRCFGRHSCYIGCTQALKAMTVIAEKRRTKEVNQFINTAISFVLLHKLYKKSIARNQPIRKEYGLLTFPLTYYDDLLQILEVLVHFHVKDTAVDEAIRLIRSKRSENGRWLLEKTVSSSAVYVKSGNKGAESKWITYRALNVLNKYQRLTSG